MTILLLLGLWLLFRRRLARPRRDGSWRADPAPDWPAARPGLAAQVPEAPAIACSNAAGASAHPAQLHPPGLRGQPDLRPGLLRRADAGADRAVCLDLWKTHARLTPLQAFSLAIPLGLLLPPYTWSYDYTLFVIPVAYVSFELIQRYRTYIYSTLFLLVLIRAGNGRSDSVLDEPGQQRIDHPARYVEHLDGGVRAGGLLVGGAARAVPLR